jgi:Polyketide cyclase / dehydrase and lipid transport
MSELNTGENLTPVYLMADGELILDAPPDSSWPHVIDYTSWQGFSAVEHVSGRRGEAGELVLLRKEEPGFEFPPYFARTIKIDPGVRVIWKTYPADGSASFFGIVDYRLEPEGGSTRFVWSVLYEFLVPSAPDEELEEVQRQQYDNFQRLFDSVFPKLGQQVRAAVKDPA